MTEYLDLIGTVLSFKLLEINNFVLRVGNLMFFLAVLTFTKIGLWVISRIILKKFIVASDEIGNAYALYKIISYFVWVIAIGFCIESLGISLNVIIASSAALLVGIGLGLQQTFNDIVSGIIILFERKVQIKDVLEINGEVLRVKSIGIRTSTAENRDQIAQIIPNSQLTNSTVINWSHQSKHTRFSVTVGVAYGSDIDLVGRLIEESATESPGVLPGSESRMIDFGESSLDFEVLFFSSEIFYINRIKSDVRKRIYRKFEQHGITIPFPQRDLHIIAQTPARSTAEIAEHPSVAAEGETVAVSTEEKLPDRSTEAT